MPRLSIKLPKYRKHTSRDLAFVVINGKRRYLPGKYGSNESKEEYRRLLVEWEVQGRSAGPADATVPELAISELLTRYWRFARLHYQKRDKGTSELDNIKYALRPLNELYGRTLVKDFGPLALKALQVRMIEDGLSRGVINSRIGKIKRVFRWAVSEELAPPSLTHAQSTVMGLQKGRTKAREADPVKPVDDKTIEATLPHLPFVVVDMVRFQRLTGCRPDEVCSIRPHNIDRASDVWLYTPNAYKTEHYDRTRVVAIGPKAQKVLLPYLLRDAEAFCFSPADSDRKRKEAMRARRKSSVQPTQQDRSKRNAQRKPGERYTSESYANAVSRACERAFPPPAPLARRDGETVAKWKARLTEKQQADLKAWNVQHRWSPNQLRHTAATEIRRRYGLEGAQVTLGHANADVSQIYAERDLEKAVQIMREVG